MGPWIQGVPSVEMVRRHDDAHAVGHRMGAQWLCKDPKWSGVQVIRLSVVDDRVQVANGAAFWQPLDEARWAARSLFRPVDPEGYEVSL